MIALIVGDEAGKNRSLRWALAQAGFEPREAATTDQADFDVSNHDERGCVLIVEAESLAKRAGSATWASFLTGHRGVPAVVVARGEVDAGARQATPAPHRILLDNPADAAAVVAAARRAAA